MRKLVITLAASLLFLSGCNIFPQQLSELQDETSRKQFVAEAIANNEA